MSNESELSDTVRAEGFQRLHSVESALSQNVPTDAGSQGSRFSGRQSPILISPQHSPASLETKKKRVTWNTVDLDRRSGLASTLSRTLDKGLLRVFYSTWVANVQYTRLNKVNQSLQRMLGDGSKLVDSKVKTLQEDCNRKAEKIKDLTAKVKKLQEGQRQASISSTTLARDKDSVIAGLRQQLQARESRIEDLTQEVGRLNGEVLKANEAILTGADEYHAVTANLQKAERSLQAVKTTLSPERLRDALTVYPSSSNPTNPPSWHAQNRAAATQRSRTVMPQGGYNSAAGLQHSSLHGMGVGPPSCHSSEPNPSVRGSPSHVSCASGVGGGGGGAQQLSVEHHLSELIKKRRGLVTPPSPEQPQQASSGGAQLGEVESTASKDDARKALGLLLHQVQMQKVLAERRDPADTRKQSETLGVLQSTLRGLLVASNDRV